MRASKKVTVVLAVKNGEAFMAKMIDSVVSQTYENWELLIVSDDSTDKTESIALSYSADERIKYYESSGGVGRARNLGIEKSTGEYIIFVDADDVLPENSLEVRCRAMESQGMVLGIMHTIRPDNRKMSSPDVPKEYCNGMDYLKRAQLYESGCTTGLEYAADKMFLTSIIRKGKVAFTTAKISEDSIFVLDYLCCCDLPIRCIDKVIYTYIQRSGSASATFPADEAILTYRQYYDKMRSLALEYHMGTNVEQGISHGYLNKVIFVLYRKKRETASGNRQELVNFCRDVLGCDDIAMAAKDYTSKNEYERMKIVELIGGGNAEELADYLIRLGGVKYGIYSIRISYF